MLEGLQRGDNGYWRGCGGCGGIRGRGRVGSNKCSPGARISSTSSSTGSTHSDGGDTGSTRDDSSDTNRMLVAAGDAIAAATVAASVLVAVL